MTTTQDVIVPIIHMNGDTAKTLIANLEAQYVSLSATIKVMQQGVPNGRNYYPDPGRYEKAMTQFMERYQTLADLRDDLLAELEGIQKQRK